MEFARVKHEYARSGIDHSLLLGRGGGKTFLSFPGCVVVVDVSVGRWPCARWNGPSLRGAGGSSIRTAGGSKRGRWFVRFWEGFCGATYRNISD